MSLQCCQRFANVEAQFGVQAHRAIVVGQLDKSDTESVSLGTALQNCCHQCATDVTVLHLRVDRHRTHAEDRAALIEEIASDYMSVGFGDDTEEAGMRHERGHEFGCHATDGKSGGKLWLLAIASNASKQMRPHSGMSAAVMGRISRFTSFLSSSGGTFTAVAARIARAILKFHGGEAR